MYLINRQIFVVFIILGGFTYLPISSSSDHIINDQNQTCYINNDLEVKLKLKSLDKILDNNNYICGILRL